jgi:hypothetical protein
VSNTIAFVTGVAALLIDTTPSPAEFEFENPPHKLSSELGRLTVRYTVPVYAGEVEGVTVMISVPDVPWDTARVLGVDVRVIVPLPELTVATFTVTLPVEPA